MSNTSNLSFEERVEFLEGKSKEMRQEVLKMIHKAQSGHPGGSLSSADIMAVLYFDQMNLGEDPKACTPNRDRFVLSKGHACPIWYVSLALKGYFPMEDLAKLRQINSPLQGHPVKGKCNGIEATTGSLGIGFAQAVGMALEAKMTNSDYRVYSILGDGETQEGAIWEAAQTCNKYALDNMTVFVDKNNLQNDGRVEDIMPVGCFHEKFQAFGFETIEIDGHNISEIIKAVEKAKKVKGKPTCIIANTVKGKGVSFMEDVRGWHGKAPNVEELSIALKDIQEGF
jgi:transketolase